ncbi:hypothetical protein EUTSA_v10002097mg [Eutrema salsugineum]|nr:hypothetical protein EUTSA_v10002097mg [Eutrema salsugineum]
MQFFKVVLRQVGSRALIVPTNHNHFGRFADFWAPPVPEDDGCLAFWALDSFSFLFFSLWSLLGLGPVSDFFPLLFPFGEIRPNKLLFFSDIPIAAGDFGTDFFLPLARPAFPVPASSSPPDSGFAGLLHQLAACLARFSSAIFSCTPSGLPRSMIPIASPVPSANSSPSRSSLFRSSSNSPSSKR